jgi:hypothetical protein
VTRQRTTISKADYDKAAVFLMKLGRMPVALELTPGKARIELAGGDELALPYGLAAAERLEAVERAKERWAAEEERAKDRIGQYGKRKKQNPKS